ncbi:Arp2/3 complex subunit [Gurleya vavrai]
MKTFIISHGSYTIKSGYSDDQMPNMHRKAEIVNNNIFSSNSFNPSVFIDNYHMHFPLEKGLVYDFENMINIWDVLFDKIYNLNYDDTTIFILSPLYQSKKSNKKLMEIMFERYKFNGFLIQDQSSMILHALNINTGLIIDSGYTETRIVPVLNSTVYTTESKSLNIGGKDITDYLAFNMENKNQFSCCNHHYEEVNKIKEALCFVKNKEVECYCKNNKNEFCKIHGDKYDHISNHSSQLYEACDILFEPSLINKGCQSISLATKNVLYEFENKYGNDTLKNIILYGSNAYLRGFYERMNDDLADISDKKINLINCKNKQSLEWLGAKKIVNSDVYTNLRISRSNYQNE